MKIVRGKQTFELTPAEIREAANEYWHACFNEDVASQMESYADFKQVNVADLKAPSAERVNSILDHCDGYWDAYWQCIDYAIRECNEE